MNSQVSPEWIVNAIRQYLAEQSKTHPDIAMFVELLDALPLYVSWGGGVALCPDGELIGFRWDEPQWVKVETDPHLRFIAVVAGAKNYAELACLAPARTANDRDCPICDGTGRLRELEEAGIETTNISCYCSGTGWLPLNVPDPPQG